MGLQGRGSPHEAAAGFPHTVLGRYQRRGNTRILGLSRNHTRTARRCPAGGCVRAPTGVRTRREPLPPERTEARHPEVRRGPDGLEANASARRVRHFRAATVLPGRRCLETAVLRGSAPVRRRGWARGGGLGSAEGCEVVLGLRGAWGGNAGAEGRVAGEGNAGAEGLWGPSCPYAHLSARSTGRALGLLRCPQADARAVRAGAKGLGPAQPRL